MIWLWLGSDERNTVEGVAVEGAPTFNAIYPNMESRRVGCAGSDTVSHPGATLRRPCRAEVKQTDSQSKRALPMTVSAPDAPMLRRPLIRANPKTPKLVRLDVLEAATHVSGKACQLLVGLMLLVVIRGAPSVPLTRRTMARVNVSREAAGPALRRLEAAGLVKVWRLPGRASMVCLLEPGKTTPLVIHPQDQR